MEGIVCANCHAWKVAPALAAGCAVVLKPAEQTPLTALPGLTWKADGDAIQAQCALVTGVKPGQGPSADGLWSVEEVECLAGCGSGPCVQVNHDVYDEFVDEKKLLDVMEACKRGDYRPWAK